MSNASALIKATGIGILRGERVVLEGVNLTAHVGDAIVLRGANGAGKTTLLRILAGLTQPETGEVTDRAPFHWLAHREGLKPHETPRTHLALWAKAWGADSTKLDKVLQKVGLTRPANVPARHLSAGQRRRTAMARLFLEDRPLWLLDEPFTALDAEGKAFLLQLIADHRAAGGAVIAAIHGEAGFDASQEVSL